MKSLKINHFLIMIFSLFTVSLHSQTFSTFDSFSKKSHKTKIKTTNYIITLDTEKSNDTTHVSGKVLDSGTKTPLSGITITEKGTINGTITNSDGKFILKTNNRNSLLSISNH